MWLVALLAPVARSSRSTTVTLQPERAASRATPSPVTPPPSTSRSRSGPLIAAMVCTALCASRAEDSSIGRPVAAGSRAASVRLGRRLLRARHLGLRAVVLVQLPVGLEVARHARQLARGDQL